MRPSRRTIPGHKIVREELSHAYCGTLVYTVRVCVCVCRVWCICMWIICMCMTEQLCTLDRFTEKAQFGKTSAFHIPPPAPQPENNSSSAKYRTSAFYLSLLSHSVPPHSNTQNILSYLSNILRNASSLFSFILATSHLFSRARGMAQGMVILVEQLVSEFSTLILSFWIAMKSNLLTDFYRHQKINPNDFDDSLT